MYRKTLVSLLSIALLAAMVFAPSAEAQRDGQRRGDGDGQGRRGSRGGGFGFGGGGDAKLGLLRVPEVREEVKVTEDQQELIDILSDELREGRPDFPENYRDLSDEEQEAFREKMRGWNDQQSAQARETLKTILEETQYTRLREIMVQSQGVRALFDTEISELVKLSEDQIAKLRETEQKSREEMFARIREGGGFGGGEGGFDRDAMRERFEAARKEQEEKMLAHLSDDQKQAFAKLKGEAFEMPERGFGFGGGGRGGGEGFGGRRRGGDSDRPERPE